MIHDVFFYRWLDVFFYRTGVLKKKHMYFNVLFVCSFHLNLLFTRYTVGIWKCAFRAADQKSALPTLYIHIADSKALHGN